MEPVQEIYLVHECQVGTNGCKTVILNNDSKYRTSIREEDKTMLTEAIRCPYCGAELNISEDHPDYTVCESCGTTVQLQDIRKVEFSGEVKNVCSGKVVIDRSREGRNLIRLGNMAFNAGNYLEALRKIFVIEDSVAWNPNLRSKTAIRTANTRYFIDPSIGTAVLGLGPKDLINDLNTMGLFFETLCVRDLRVFAEVLDGEIYHYRDKNGLECDAVIHLRNGKYGLVEIKLGGDKLINEGAENLLNLAGKINTEKMNDPSFMMVLTGTGDFAYRRKDGVYVVPIGCLRD